MKKMQINKTKFITFHQYTVESFGFFILFYQ